MATTIRSPQNILVAEDSSDDVFFVRHAINHACSKDIIVVNDGEECITYLSQCFTEGNSHRLPDLIVLDLKMPRVDGHEVLAWIRTQPALKDIPVVVMSGSIRQADRDRSLAAGANAFFCKPVRLEETMEIVKKCGRQWLDWCHTAIPRSFRHG